MSIRKKLALWLCPELGEQLSACRTAWAKHCLSVSGSEGTDFLNLDEMTEPERAEAELMQQAVAEQFAQLMSSPAASAVRAAGHAALSASAAMVSADKARARVEPMTAMGTAGPEAVVPRRGGAGWAEIPRTICISDETSACSQQEILKRLERLQITQDYLVEKSAERSSLLQRWDMDGLPRSRPRDD